jgi:C-terminal processing protease CtpA/Prc
MENDTPDSVTWWRNDPETERQGFGIVFHAKGDNWVVHRTMRGSPADLAGVRSGDIIHTIKAQPASKSLRRTKLTATIDLLESGIDHEIGFLRGQEQFFATMRPRILRELIEAEMAQAATGENFSYCYSCPNCYSRTSGSAQCSDCPTYNCTTG